MYWITLSIGVCVCWLCYALRMKDGLRAVVLSLPLGCALAAALAKAGYVLLMAQRQLGRYGAEAFLMWNRPEHFSLLCGACGMVLGVALAARWTRTPLAKALDAFAPGGALLLCALRVGEYWLGTLGIGRYYVAGDSALARFPFSVPNSWGEMFPAIFFLEALFALLCGVGMLLWRKKPAWRTPGVTFELTAILLLLPQVFCESLRANSIKWGFVRVEQALCGVLVLLIVVLRLRRVGSTSFWPAVGVFACILLVVWVELALDKWSSWPDWANYLLMWAALAGMFACAMCAIRGNQERTAA